MRVTHMLVARRTQNYIQNAMQRLARTQEQMSTGRKVLRLSDDPPALSQLLNVRAAVERNKQYMRNITDGLSYLEGADTALGTAGELLQKAMEYAIQGANGTLEPDDMAAIGEQIDKMIDELVDIANTTVGGKYIFAGTKNNQPPFWRDGDKIYYRGNLERISREILDQANYPIDVPAVTLDDGNPDTPGGVFGEAQVSGNEYELTGGIFQVLLALRNSLKAADVSGVNDSIGALNTQLDHILRYRVQVGARTSHFESVRSQLQDQELRLTQVLSNLEDADVARVAVDLSRQQLSYQAALAAGVRILETSLLDYLR
ncbi:flagellar hook-associated protein FlgL [Desulfofundulus thermosubterraneus]|uniref:Flagellar hook-associated protein 3 FlgL n=1 Tax=Desulfofundulus thermosubterraneus DSM 16057 TaxID=1121432 RepID=A0A1M6K3R6_9FIRM|nr:flagellar hook-associated protein FlgL [Desulfofundulus thermosubterraneus]SHJ53623.1 flagellar hook-associated protein 3 FlgL [Desulfofundulus thermosubterraneus DSM 16057]